MKKITIITVSILIITNLLTIPIFTTLNQINDNIGQLTANIPDNTIYIDSNIDTSDSDNSQLITSLKQLEGVTAVTAHNIYDLQETYYDGQVDVESNQIVGRYTIPTIIFDDASAQQYPIIAGSNLSGDGQIVLSSSLVEHLGISPEEMIGNATYSLEVVGVYDDPNPYQQIDDDNSYKLINFDNYQTTNFGYTIDSNYQQTNLKRTYADSDLNRDNYQIEQAIEITFDNNDTQANLQMLLDKIGNSNVYISKLGIEDQNRQYAIYQYFNIDTRQAKVILLIVDILVISLLLLIHRKEN